jgi:hypothetical protein
MEGTIHVPGGQVWYQTIGDRSAGIPLLCLHGGRGMAHDYINPLADLWNRAPSSRGDHNGEEEPEKPRSLAESPPGDSIGEVDARSSPL